VPGLPQEAFEYQYSASGAPDLATQIASTLQAAGFQPILDAERGWDHGVFVPLIIMRPQADLPVIQMSILKGGSDESEAEKNMRYGAAMEKFRDEGYVLLFSGSSYHHLEKVLKALPERMGNGKVDKPTHEFEAELERVATISDAEKRSAILRTWRRFPQSYEAHPAGKAEHFMPFLVGSGAAGNDQGKKTQSWELFGAPMGTFVW
jgi:aromatic ring-opening dioxygenase catalytic subunit (LigB family)